MSDVRWMAVRCCCTPRKILGFMQVPDRCKEFQVLDHMRQQHTVKLQIAGECRITDGEITRSTEVAIYSEERPIEFWRTIPGFVEARNQENDHGR